MNLFEAARLGDAEQVRALLARKARPGAILREAAVLGENLLAIRNYTPLMIAAAGGHVEVVRLLLDAGAEPDRQDDYGYTAVHLAALLEHQDVVTLLAERGANLDLPNNNRDTPLAAAFLVGKTAGVLALLRAGADVNLRDGAKTPPLSLAVQGWRRAGINDRVDRARIEGLSRATGKSVETLLDAQKAVKRAYWQIIKAMLAAGADVNAANTEHLDTPLHEAAQAEDPACAKLLIGHGADVHAQNCHGCTPLFEAADKLKTLRCLLDAGSDPNHADRDGDTTLFNAVSGKNERAVRLLVGRGATIALANRAGKTVLDQAAAAGATAMYDLLRRLGGRGGVTPADHTLLQAQLQTAVRDGNTAQVRTLLRRGPDLDNTAESKGEPPLWLAADKGHEAIVGLLLAAGADPNVKGMYDSRPIHRAAEGGQGGIVRRLLAAGADVRVCAFSGSDGTEGSTPLHYACQGGDLETVRLLRAAGCDVNAARDDGLTPLLLAATLNCPTVVRLLQRAGATHPLAEHFLESLDLTARVQQAAFKKAVAKLSKHIGVKPLDVKEFPHGAAFVLAKSRLARDLEPELADRLLGRYGGPEAEAREHARQAAAGEAEYVAIHRVIDELGDEFRERGCLLLYVATLPGHTLVLLPTTNPYAAVVRLGPFPRGPLHMIEFLLELAEDYSWSLHGASYDTLMLRFRGQVADPEALSRRFYRQLYPHEYGVIVDGLRATGSKKEFLEQLGKKSPLVRLWWD